MRSGGRARTVSGRRRRQGVLAAALLVAGGCSMAGVPPAAPPRTGPSDASLPDRPPQPAAPAGQPAAGAGAGPGGTARALRRFAEVRGLWVVRFSLSGPASVDAVVERADRAGFNTLLVQVRGRGDAVHASTLEPRTLVLAGQPDSFDPLERIIRQAHARGMAVHAWVNLNVVTDLTTLPTDARHLARAHPEALMVPRALARELAAVSPYDPRYPERLLAWSRANSERVEGLYAGPWSMPVRERAVAVSLELAERYDLDGIHLDYMRFPGPDFDYSAGALAAFRGWAAPHLSTDRRRTLDRAAEHDPLAWADRLPDLWSAFRREQITTLLEWIHFGVKARRPWMTISAAVVPDTAEARRDRLQDWPAWARAGLLDAVAPMAYAPDDRRFRRQVAGALAAVPRPGPELWAGIGSYLAGLEGTLTKIAIARDLGADGVVLFSYDWAVGASGREDFLDRVGGSSFGR